MNATSATPLIRLPEPALVWLDGRLSMTVTRLPRRSTCEMRAPTGLPVYGPTSGTTCAQSAAVVAKGPPVPPSATYKLLSGPNLSPRGLLNPVAKTVTLGVEGAG